MANVVDPSPEFATFSTPLAERHQSLLKVVLVLNEMLLVLDTAGKSSASTAFG